MTWNDITLGKYLEIHPVIENDWGDFDKFREIVYNYKYFICDWGRPAVVQGDRGARLHPVQA